MTPLQMGIMLAAFTGCREYDFNNVTTHTYQTQISCLTRLGYITPTAKYPAYPWDITEKGKVWLDTALATPEPTEVTMWVVK